MVIAIHKANGDFSERWIAYCKERNVDLKIVNCYSSNIIEQLTDCDALMWHFHQSDSKDLLFAKQLLYSVEACGKKVFPNFRTMWHFDDKVGQKYLLEGIGAPCIPSWVFYEKQRALEWIADADWPMVFKLRRGAGSANVSMLRTKQEAERVINKAFGSGFDLYNPWENLKERIRKYKLSKTTLLDVFKGVVRLAYKPKFSDVAGKEKGYVYFQKFIANNDHDIRIIVIGDKAFAIKRMVRAGDFRASGSGNILYDKSFFKEDTVRQAFQLAEKIGSQCVAFDFIYQNNNPLVVEISYGFSPEPYGLCSGYWDKNMKWYAGKFNPCEWMVDLLINK